MLIVARFRTIVRAAGGWKLVAALFAASVIGAAPASVQAGSVTYVTPTGSSTTGGSVDAQAVFTFGTNEVEITLTNLFKNPTADSQLISALTFDVSGVTGSGSLTTTNSGKISTISAGGSFTAGVSDSLTRWDASKSGTSIDLTTLSGGKPNRLIIGPDDNGGFDPTTGKYTKANSSIIQHNPSVLGSATFDITIAGVTSSSSLSNVVFQFGTTAGSNLVDGVKLSSVPEPSSIVMALISLTAVTGVVVRGRRRTARA
jgi:hypothetical protein